MRRSHVPVLLVIAAGMLGVGIFGSMGCGSFDQQVKDAEETRMHMMALQRDIDELQQAYSDLPQHMATTGQYLQRAREALQYISLSDPQMSQLLQQPLSDLEDAAKEIQDSLEKTQEVQERISAIRQRSGLALQSATKTWQGAIELRNRASFIRNLAGLVGLRFPGSSSDGEASSGANPWKYILGTGATMSIGSGLAYGGYRIYQNRRREKEDEEKQRSTATTNNVSVSIPPPQYGMPQMLLAGAARGGIPPPTAGMGAPAFGFNAQFGAGMGAQTPLGARAQVGAQVPINHPAAAGNVVATAPPYQAQQQPPRPPRVPMSAAATHTNLTVPPADQWPPQ